MNIRNLNPKDFDQNDIYSEKEAIKATLQKIAGIMSNRRKVRRKKYFVCEDMADRITLLEVSGIPSLLPECLALCIFPPWKHEDLRYVRIFSARIGFSESKMRPKITGIMWDTPKKFRHFDEIFKEQLSLCAGICGMVKEFEEYFAARE